MNALVRKEIRSLVPNFILALVLILSVLAFTRSTDLNNFQRYFGFVPPIICPALGILMALETFGREFSAGTFSQLLAQPISRKKIWRVKTTVLAAASLLIWITWIICFNFTNVPRAARIDDLINPALFALVIYTGGLWTVLLLRQVAAAFWLTILIPCMLIVVIQALLQAHPENITGVQTTVLLTYSVAGFFFARRLFLRAQDAQWTGGTIVFPELRALASRKSSAAVRRQSRPLAALLGKEFQLHQSQLVIAGGLALLHLGILFWRHHVPDLHKHQDLEYILNAFWILWLGMPLLIGCAAAAEERKLATLESQFCLPVNRRLQLILKLFVVLLLSVLLGFGLPLLFEGTRIIPDLGYGFGYWPTHFFLPVVCLGIAALSFYISTLVRNTLQAIGPAILMNVAAVIVFLNAYRLDHVFDTTLWRGPLACLIGVPVFIFVFTALMFWNFKWLIPGARVWRQNALILLATFAFVIVATTVTYHRAWERFLPFEPAHGAARMSPGDSNVLLHDDLGDVFIRLPDTRLWGDFFQEYGAGDRPNILAGPINLSEGFFANGSNWLTAIQDWSARQTIALKTDGTLWVSEKPIADTIFMDRNPTIVPEKMMRFGNETDWKGILQSGPSEILLKNNGTLWRWGPTNYNSLLGRSGLQAFTPFQLGSASDWSEMYSFGNHRYFRKTDGSVWTDSPRYDDENYKVAPIKLAPGLELHRTVSFEPTNWLSTSTISLVDGLSYQIGIRQDGTFRIWANREFDAYNRYYRWAPTDFPIGNQTNWLAMAGWDDQAVTLKKDGSLWLWNFRFNRRNGVDLQRDEDDLAISVPTRLGIHSDWVAIVYRPGGFLSLAADGSLWFWPLESRYFYGEKNLEFSQLLEFSRKPRLIANIFSTK